MADSPLNDKDQDKATTSNSRSRPSSVTFTESFSSPKPETPRNVLGIKPKIYDTPESLSMSEAYEKIYSCSSRNRHRQRTGTPVAASTPIKPQRQELLPFRLVEDGGVDKAVSEYGQKIDLDSIAQMRGADDFVNREILPGGGGVPLQEESGRNLELEKNDSDILGQELLAVPSTSTQPRLKNSKDLERGGGATKLEKNGNDPRDRGLSARAPTPPLPKARQVVERRLNKQKNGSDPLGISSTKESRNGKPIERAVTRQQKSGKGLAREVNTPQEAMAILTKELTTAMDTASSSHPHRPESATVTLTRNKARAQSPSPYRGVKTSPATSRTGLARNGSPVSSIASSSSGKTVKQKTAFTAGLKTPVNSKIPLALTPRFTPKFTKTFKPTPIRPLKAKPLQPPEAVADFELSPMPSLNAIKDVDPPKPMAKDITPMAKDITPMAKGITPTVTAATPIPDAKSTKKAVSTVPLASKRPVAPLNSYAERQMAKMAKKPDSLNEKIRRRIRTERSKTDLVPVSPPGQQQQSAEQLTEKDVNKAKDVAPKPEQTPVRRPSAGGLSEQVIEADKAVTLTEQIPIQTIQQQTSEECLKPLMKVESVPGICEQITPALYDSEEEELKLANSRIKSLTLPSVAISIEEGNKAEVIGDVAVPAAEESVPEPEPIAMIPCRFKVAGCNEVIARGTPSETEHYRNCEFRPIPCIIHHHCKEMVPHHSFLLHLQHHYLTPNFTKALTTTVILTLDTFMTDSDSWLPKWLKIQEYDANFFLMLTRSKGAIPGVDEACWMCWVWMMGSQEEASNYFYEVDIFKNQRKISGTFTTQSIRSSPADIVASKSCLSFTDRVAKHIADIGDTVVGDFFIDIFISKKPSTSATSSSPPSFRGEYLFP